MKQTANLFQFNRLKEIHAFICTTNEAIATNVAGTQTCAFSLIS